MSSGPFVFGVIGGWYRISILSGWTIILYLKCRYLSRCLLGADSGLIPAASTTAKNSNHHPGRRLSQAAFPSLKAVESIAGAAGLRQHR